MFEIWQQLATLSTQMKQISSCFVEREERLAEEAAKAAAMRSAQRVEGELRKERKVAD